MYSTVINFNSRISHQSPSCVSVCGGVQGDGKIQSSVTFQEDLETDMLVGQIHPTPRGKPKPFSSETGSNVNRRVVL